MKTSSNVAATIALAARGSGVATGQALRAVLSPEIGTATAAAGAATLASLTGKVTTEALTTAGLAAYTLTLTNAEIAAADMVWANVANGTNTQGTVAIGRVTPAAGSVVIMVHNLHASQALNGTLVIGFRVIKAAA